MTDRENTIEDALPQSEAFNRTVVESSRDCLKILSLDGRLLWMNEEGQRMLCIADFAAVVGKSWIDFWAAEDRVAATKAIAAAIRGGSGSFSAMYIVAGEERWFDVLISPIRGRDGNPHRLLASSRDITLRKRLEDSLRRSEERSQIVGHATNDAVWDWDLQTNSVWWNQGVTSLFGYQSNQVAPDISWWYERVHPDDCARIRASLDKAIEGTQVGWRGEYRFRREDGSYADVFDRGYIMRGQGRKAVRMIGAMQDTSERKRAEDALRESERRFRAIGDDAPIFMWMADENLDVTYVNRTYLDYLGLRTAADFSGHVWERLMHPDDIVQTYDVYLGAVKSRQPFQLEARMRAAATAEHRWHLFRGTPRFIDGRFIGFMGIGFDIEDRKRFEQSLQHSEAELRQAEERARRQFTELEAIYDTAPLGLCVLDTELRYRRVNRRLAELNGASVEAHIGRTVREVVPDLAVQAEAALRNVLATGQPLRVEFRGETPASPGLERIWDEQWYPLRGGEGKTIGIGVVAEEVTERRRLENAVRESERRFRSFVEATAHVIWRTDAHGAVDTWLKEWCAFTGQSEEEARGFGWMNAIHRDDRPKVAGAWENASKTRATYEVEYRLKIHTGQWRDILARGVPVLDDEGEVLEYIGTCIDITEQKKAESALRRSEEQYRELFSSIDEGFCVIEMLFDGQNRPIDYRFIEVNPAFTRQTGLPDAVGKTVREMVPQHEQHWFDIYGGIVTTGTPVRFEQHAAALGRWYDVYAFRLRRSQRVGVLFHDVTVRKRAEQAIRESEQRLEQLVAERTGELRETVGELEAFSYTIAHDMRAPLRAMQSFADILTHDYAHELTVEAQGLLGRIATSANRLDNLIQDVLNYSKVVRANLTLQRVNTRVLLAEIIDTYPNLQRNAAHIALPDSLPDVIGNRAALTQVFSNLLGNAVKFVPPGSAPRITIRAEPAPTSVQNGNPRTDNCNTRCVRLWFEDNGIGIAPQEIPKLFHMFHRAHAPGSYEGTGVGLAIVRKAVERMSGRVGVESELGKGSKFWIELPSGYN